MQSAVVGHNGYHQHYFDADEMQTCSAVPASWVIDMVQSKQRVIIQLHAKCLCEHPEVLKVDLQHKPEDVELRLVETQCSMFAQPGVATLHLL